MDTFRPTLLQALLNMTVQLRNVVVKCRTGSVVAVVGCSSLHGTTAADPEAHLRSVSSAALGS